MNGFKRNILMSAVEDDTPPVCPYRYLGEVQVSAHFPEVVTLQYIKKEGGAVSDEWHAGGTGEEVYHTFGVGFCVLESSVGIDEGTLIANIWFDGIVCCP